MLERQFEKTLKAAQLFGNRLELAVGQILRYMDETSTKDFICMSGKGGSDSGTHVVFVDASANGFLDAIEHLVDRVAIISAPLEHVVSA